MSSPFSLSLKFLVGFQKVCDPPLSMPSVGVFSCHYRLGNALIDNIDSILVINIRLGLKYEYCDTQSV